MLREPCQQRRPHESPMLAANWLTSPLPRQRPWPISRVRRPPVPSIQNKRVRTGGVQPTELVGRTIDRHCYDVMPGTNRGKLDGTIQITPVEQLKPVRAGNSQMNRSGALIFGLTLQEHER